MYMGNTRPALIRLHVIRDHPHIHGEYSADDINRIASAGSPPHTWGIPIHFGSRIHYRRITPTYMGNTLKDPCHTAILKSQQHHFY